LSRRNIVAGIDIGTNKIVALIGEIIDEELSVIGVGKVKVNAINSDGAITNIDDLKNKIQIAIEEAEKMADVQVDSLFVNLFGNNIRCFSAKGTVSISSRDKGIISEDLSRVLEDVKNNIIIPEGYEIVHILARNFSVDEMTGIKDPIGMKGSSLEADVYVVTSSIAIITNIENSIQSAGFDISDFVYEPLASAESVLTEDEKKLGAAVVDIGGGYTTISVYKNGSIVSSAFISMGSASITSDLAIILRTSFEEAEKIKIRHGNLYNLENDNEKVELFNTSRESVKIVTKKYINEILFARFEEVFKFVYEHLEKEGLVEDIKAGIVLTGGGSQVEGLPVYVEHLFEMPVRNGRPLSLKGLFDKINSPVYTVATGILRYARKSNINAVKINNRFLSNMIYKIKEFFDTYF